MDARATVELGPKPGIFALLTLAKRVDESAGLAHNADSSPPSAPNGHLSEAKNQGPAQEDQPGHPGSGWETPQARQNRAAQP